MVPCNTTHRIFVEDFCCKIVGLGKRLGGGTLEAVPALRCERLFSSQSKLGSPEVPLFVAHTDFWRFLVFRSRSLYLLFVLLRGTLKVFSRKLSLVKRCQRSCQSITFRSH